MTSFFSSLYNMIGGEKVLKGIDISRYQAGINIDVLDVDFVIAKATEGVGYSDPNYEEYMTSALNSNKLIGLYHYARPDLNNSPGREGHAIMAGTFIGEFAEDTPWVHLDIAGTSVTSKPTEIGPSGATGVMTRSLAQFVIDFQ